MSAATPAARSSLISNHVRFAASPIGIPNTSTRRPVEAVFAPPLRAPAAAVHAKAEADAGEVLAAKLGHQAVVATATADSGLGPETIVDKLETGLGVVIKPTDHAWVDRVCHTHVLKQARDGIEVLAGGIREVILHQRSVRQHFLHLRALIIQHSQRVELRAALGLLIQRKRCQELLSFARMPGDRYLPRLVNSRRKPSTQWNGSSGLPKQ